MLRNILKKKVHVMVEKYDRHNYISQFVQENNYLKLNINTFEKL